MVVRYDCFTQCSVPSASFLLAQDAYGYYKVTPGCQVYKVYDDGTSTRWL